MKVLDLLFGPENILGAPRVPLVQMDNRPIWVESPVAQSLGLTDQEIVQATVTLERGSVRLWLKNFSFDIPTTWGLKPGDRPFVSVFQSALGYGLHLQNANLSASATTPLGDVKNPSIAAVAQNKPQAGAAQVSEPGAGAANAAGTLATSTLGLKPAGIGAAASPSDPSTLLAGASPMLMLGSRTAMLSSPWALSRWRN